MLEFVTRLTLSALFLTVVFFALATWTWPHSRNAPEWAVKVLSGLLAVTGILGTFLIGAAIWLI